MDYFVKTANEGKPFSEALILDCHGHIGLERGNYLPGETVAEIVAGLDRVGINKVGVSSFSNIMPFGNDIVAKALSAFPDRFIGYARVCASYSDGIEAELTRCFDELGFKGIKLHPYCDQVSIADPRYKPVWEFSSKRGAPILIHTWNSMRYVDPMLDYCVPSLIADVAEKYPDARIMIGHSGGEYDGVIEAIEVAKKYPNAFLDTCSSRLYPGVIEMMVEKAGAEKVLYGSDVPYISPVAQLGKIIYADITEAEKRMILGENYAKLFGIN